MFGEVFVHLKTDGDAATARNIEKLAAKSFSGVTAFYGLGSRLGICMSSSLSLTRIHADGQLLHMMFQGSSQLAPVPCPSYLLRDYYPW